ncbi:hypothetical protein BU26DRAFT_209379 [Trematosphaeria pertusa]|uniref:Uncharacterized protein n=1 Tax=Trematosphaeria pertusa TaxID=390896 RepID=A0A6A6ISG5_9PLEO|nr:uncharacterized protein BU26DRAFT_209379 [Trematosphaeria pertusa]KAF2252782.1 hypothetical protein BU26DRAFT_209379 [Trematosphaeria pertusa]
MACLKSLNRPPKPQYSSNQSSTSRSEGNWASLGTLEWPGSKEYRSWVWALRSLSPSMSHFLSTAIIEIGRVGRRRFFSVLISTWCTVVCSSAATQPGGCERGHDTAWLDQN